MGLKSSKLPSGETKPLSLDEVARRPHLEPHEVASLQLTPHAVYATLAAHVYSAASPATSPQVPLPDGWEVLMTCASLQLDREGYYAVAYIHRKQRHCIIAQRGTSEVLGLRAGVWIYFEEPTIQFFLAEQFSKEVRRTLALMEENDYSTQPWFLSYTGHSLGAVIASCRAAEEQAMAVVFESPGAKNFLQKVTNQVEDVEAYLTTYLRAPNPINSLKPQCGYLIVIPTEQVSLPSGTLFLTPTTSPPSTAAVSVEVKAGGAVDGTAARRQTTPAPSSAAPPVPVVTSGGAVSASGGSGGPSRWRVPSFRPQEYLRGYVLNGVGMGIPELQQYISKVEPMIREMLEHTQQVHSIHSLRRHFEKADEPGGEEDVVRWPSHLMQFMEYYNTTRALQDPDNQVPHVKESYLAMLRRLYCTAPRRRDCMAVRFFDRRCLRVVQIWNASDAPARKAWPVSRLDHKALNVIGIKDGFVLTRVITAMQARQYLMRLVSRPDVRMLLEQDEKDGNHSVAIMSKL